MNSDQIKTISVGLLVGATAPQSDWMCTMATDGWKIDTDTRIWNTFCIVSYLYKAPNVSGFNCFLLSNIVYSLFSILLPFLFIIV